VNTALFWKLRQRFGIAAPKVAVRTHLPWYLRWLGLALLLVCSGALAVWLYESGMRFAGFDRTEAEQERTVLRRELEAAREELVRLRAVANAAESKIAIERTAQQNLTRQLRAMEGESARLREELAVFESTLSADPRKAEGLSIQRFKVQSELLPGEFRYFLLVLAMGPKRTEFQGRYELVVSLTQGGRDAMIVLPDAGGAGAKSFSLAFKHFQRIEGSFRIDPKAQVKSVQVRVFENGATQARAVMTAKTG